MAADLSLEGCVALVTGASRGVGRGVAAELAACGVRVYATGRTVADADLPAAVTRVPCDHTEDDEVAGVFRRVQEERGRLDILVNSAWGGYEGMVEDGRFTWPVPFWEQPAWRWEKMMDAGVRALFIAGQHAARMMVPAGRGLIVNVSSWAARKHIGNAIYGVAKAATDKLTADMAHELRPHGVAVVSLYPGLVRTEAVLGAGVFDLSNSESPEFIGRAVAALWNDAGRMDRSGQVVVAAALARELGFSDVDGRTPRPLTLADV
ncbi:MAG TPA: SDR family NAD(P)-dependent oxidoreductase [Longimicrobium sp.]|nr:SDR family NAD(P)-dependent oxidoreductase [Longimicrobium sp.]